MTTAQHGRGDCSGCSTTYALRNDGLVRAHRIPGRGVCPGAMQPPVPPQAPAPAPPVRPLHTLPRRSRRVSFTAQYAGQCTTCDEPIKPGQDVEYNDYSEVVHTTCPEPTDPYTPQRNEKQCTSCNMVHAGECF